MRPAPPEEPKAFPLAVARALELAREEDTTPLELAEVLEADPALTAEALRLANSSLFGFQTQVGTLREAASRLGNGRLVEIALSAAAKVLHRPAGHLSAELVPFLWRRSLTQAVASQEVAKARGDTDPGRAFVTGLLQDIGYLLICQSHPADLRAMLPSAPATTAEALDAETELFGQDHASLGASRLSDWGLPGELVESVRRHHDPASADVDLPLEACAREGARLARHLLQEGGYVPAGEEWLLGPRGGEAMGEVPPEELGERIAKRVDEIAESL